MSAISLKSITGITSITTPAGVDNQFTLHVNDTSEALKLDHAGNIHIHNHVNTTGISSASNFKTGSSNLHSSGLSAASIDVGSIIKLGNAGVVTATTFVGAVTGDVTGNISGTTGTFGDFVDVGSNIKLGNAGVITATSFSGSGANLTNLPPSAPVGGASTNQVFFENDTAVGVGYSITSGKNAMSAGPISINAGIAVTVPSGSAWTIV